MEIQREAYLNQLIERRDKRHDQDRHRHTALRKILSAVHHIQAVSA